MKKTLYYAVLVFFCTQASAFADGIVGVSAGWHKETITLHVEMPDPHKVFTVENPNRLVVDIPALAAHPVAEIPKNYDGSLLKSVRYGRFNADTSRFVFDLRKPVQLVDAHSEKNALVIVIKRAEEKEDAQPAPEPEEKPEPKKEETKAVKEKKVKEEAKQSDEEAPSKEDKPSKVEKRRKSDKPVVVIDAGHGGIDPGTIGPRGTKEKMITLDYAKALKAALLKTKRYKVKLTRDNDVFIMLRKRVDIARKDQGDLFISLHADSAPNSDAHGLSVYTVSEKASDTETEALAARENKADVLSGMDLTDERDDVAGILISLAQRDTSNRSATFADMVVTSLDGKIHLLPNTHRFAGFAVLKAPDIPSVLVELGFLSDEEALLKSKSYRDKVTATIAHAVDRFFSVQKKVQ